jgi:predicted 3-demethylubiquinone-9 3-methyltransferase (glyoxalase superfamily)
MKNTIYPCLWFDGNAKEAASFYCSVFKNSSITTDTPLVVNFELDGKKFMGLNGGPQFKFTEAVSLVVECETQKEIDYYWEKLTADGGAESMCGWLKDKFGFSWQIVPRQIGEWMSKPDRAQAVMQEVLSMRKLDMARLQAAYEG